MGIVTGDIFYSPEHGAYTPAGRIGDRPPLCAECPPGAEGAQPACTIWERDGKPHPLCRGHAAPLEKLAFQAAPPGERVPIACYLTSSRTLESWSGNTLAVLRDYHTTRAGFGGKRIYFQAIDADGNRYHGSAPDWGALARVRRSKGHK